MELSPTLHARLEHWAKILGQWRELRTLLRSIPLDDVLSTDDGELRFERLDVYAEGALLHYSYLLYREDGTPRNPSMRLGDTLGGGTGLWFDLPDPEDDDYSNEDLSPELPTERSMLDDFPPTPEPTVVVTDDWGNRYEGLPGAGGGNDKEYHFTHHIAQPFDPRATELRVEVTDLIWTYFPDTPPGEISTVAIGRVQHGPWGIVIRL